MRLDKEYRTTFGMKKNQYILTNVQMNQVSRVQADENQRKRKRSWSKAYNFATEGMTERVCKSFFPSTLNMNHCPVDNAFSKKSESGDYWGGLTTITRCME
ncbi:hypothetical protein PoB_003619700 [Plakobranchus ocellatus]|uniref:Uncharacterized protein n=1 Tax=Plakobranchus ocellatus TaxID=259542 RepID=A0AAV4ARY1_9GAST|nr:hypothetical protein PoB_003619700 [Plakobranchus ocellatus]